VTVSHSPQHPLEPQLPHDYWQRLVAGDDAPPPPYHRSYPARLPDGRVLFLPLRVLPGGGDRAVASLIVNQASFAVEDALADAMTAAVRPLAPEVVIGVPTLGLPLAAAVARRLGHPRLVALGTSRKFWYRDDLSEPLASITTPSGSGASKRIYLDPRMLPLLAGRRVVVVDDVVSTGSSLAAVLRLLAGVDIQPVAVAVAMRQTRRWETALAPFLAAPAAQVLGVLDTPLFRADADGRWLPVP
jgi:adenine/guanine phosphoribosyltransferase-like PRPP-binding protein